MKSRLLTICLLGLFWEWTGCDPARWYRPPPRGSVPTCSSRPPGAPAGRVPTPGLCPHLPLPLPRMSLPRSVQSPLLLVLQLPIPELERASVAPGSSSLPARPQVPSVLGFLALAAPVQRLCRFATILLLCFCIYFLTSATEANLLESPLSPFPTTDSPAATGARGKGSHLMIIW